MTLLNTILGYEICVFIYIKPFTHLCYTVSVEKKNTVLCYNHVWFYHVRYEADVTDAERLINHIHHSSSTQTLRERVWILKDVVLWGRNVGSVCVMDIKDASHVFTWLLSSMKVCQKWASCLLTCCVSRWRWCFRLFCPVSLVTGCGCDSRI